MLKTRIITALILAPIAIGGIFFLPPLGFAIFTGAVITLGAWEWANMAGFRHQSGRILYALITAVILYGLLNVPAVTVLWLALAWWCVCLWLVRSYPAGTARWGSLPVRAVMGLLVLVPAWVGLNHLRTGSFQFGQVGNNLWVILYVLCVVWVADIGAYFAGRAFGKAKLAPRVSPGKSWAGVWGGLAAVGAFAVLVSQLASASPRETVLLVIASLVTGLVSVLGDLLESMLKRFRGIKDSSQLLPGHGGIMDRIDSLTAAIPVFALIITQLGWLTAGHW
ncbi:phosphatidate cytidylyltransferase [Marinobacter lutaoensis]|uniref:Phosphatidate cytidylyltransferase n=1 Tax=Marinobacter lutaoensis TaxID=135739 RepID=A0A1V2DTD8_9GAMM|nr:phosphatidate cytidylyltransferase [Marinobacter lutaoensis]MBI44391.1 phosphatidate cytidylyltransferase [Oceanospirillales bacterium]NVD35779.1 phosphatidate cytidylyltransferase [Marinobacter lutaoensis]ONF43837.1 phosphatidate cytidylyltransferase [Marinobacter lutaoensis]